MARKGITKSMVEDVIIQIKNEGGNPTTKSIREKLGTGSLSTISKFMAEYESEGELDPELNFNFAEALNPIGEETISEFLSNEHPQMSAVILSQLAPEITASVLSRYDREKTEDIMDRMEHLQPVQQRIMSTIDKVLRDEMKAFITPAVAVAGGKDFVSQVRSALKGSK